eukprot:5958123-Alexandrium_andersonii.AAC.1
MLLAHVGAPVPVRVINMYCFSRGHAQASAREHTIALVSAILAEVEQGPVLPTLIAGDLNCEVEDVPMLRALTQDQ